MVREVRGDSPSTKIVFSSLFRRYDIQDGTLMVDEINNRLRNYCQQQNMDYIDNKNITEELLGKKTLHPNLKGSSVFAKNLMSYLN